MSETAARRLASSSLAQLTLVRIREFYREPEAVFWVFIFPILLAAGLGIAFKNRSGDATRVGVMASAPEARAVARALAGERGLAAELLDDSAAARALRTGQIAVLIAPGANGTTEYRYDAQRPESRVARMLADDAIQRAAGRRDPVRVVEQHVEERGARYIDFVVPGLLGMNLMGSGIWGLGFAIVEARRKKLLKRLIATPMSRVEYLMSFLLMRLSLLTLEVVTLVGFGMWVFDVPVRGALWELALICLISALAFGALGLLISSRVRTMEAASGLMNLVMLPMWILSGVFFSAAKFPDAIQPVIQALPLTAVIDALRANMLQGSSLAAIGSDLAVIAGWMVICFGLALRLFRWR